MAFKYDSKDALQCLPDGCYDAELSKCVEDVSKKGNPMLALEWTTTAPNGRVHVVKDFITNPYGIPKLKQMAIAFGMPMEFEENCFDPCQCIGRVAKLTVTAKSVAKKDKPGEYFDSNEVVRYDIGSFDPAQFPAKPTAPPVQPGEPGEDIPF